MKMLRLPAAALAAAALALPAAAGAQVPPPGGGQPAQPAPAQPVAPKPPPQGGKMSIKLKGGLATKRLRYAVRGQKVVVLGNVKPFVEGQFATVQIVRKGKVRGTYRAPIRRKGRAGRFVVSFVTKRSALLRITAKHAATDGQVAFRAKSRKVKVGSWKAGTGARGTHVLLLQRTLRSLGYAVPVTGSYDDGTSRAVNAYRKVNSMGRNGFASKSVFAKVFRKRGAFKLRYPKAGRHVEYDWSRQVLVLAKNGRAWRTYHSSSGAPATPTVFGTYTFYRKQPGTNAKGMVQSSYFIRGYAIHGYKSVPNYPASHGCIRVPIPNATDIYNWIPNGMKIFVYR